MLILSILLFVIANPIFKSMHSNSVKKTVSKELKEKPFNIEGLENKNWVLMDYIDVIVHIFKKEFREIYELEKLWADAEIINIQ